MPHDSTDRCALCNGDQAITPAGETGRALATNSRVSATASGRMVWREGAHCGQALPLAEGSSHHVSATPLRRNSAAHARRPHLVCLRQEHLDRDPVFPAAGAERVRRSPVLGVAIADPPPNKRRVACALDRMWMALVSNGVFDDSRDDPRLFEHDGTPQRAHGPDALTCLTIQRTPCR